MENSSLHSMKYGDLNPAPLKTIPCDRERRCMPNKWELDEQKQGVVRFKNQPFKEKEILK